MSTAAAAAAVWNYRLQLVFHQRGCVVLQSPAISLFTEVKAVSCWVPGASIPIQWLIQACTGTLCCCLSIQCMQTCSNSHYEHFFFGFSSERIHPSPSCMNAIHPYFRSPLFLTLNTVHTNISSWCQNKDITVSLYCMHWWKVVVWPLRSCGQQVMAVPCWMSRYTCIWMYRWDVSCW